MSTYWLLALALFAFQVLGFVISIIKKRNDIADVVWGLGFVYLACLSYAMGTGHSRALLVNGLITLWGLRLALHIYLRSKGKPEDYRYAQWRSEWKHVYLRSFLQVFMLQGLFLYIIAWPVMLINLALPVAWQWWDGLALLLWCIGFAFESIGDYQLIQFKKNPANRGKLITTGLWRYSRHPNYFGDALQWWAIFLFALALPMGWITVLSPLLLTYLLRYVSGVPMLERKYASHPEFEMYKQKTSAFFPWFTAK